MGSALRVREVMSRRVESLREEQHGTVGSLMGHFRRHRHLPVVDAGQHPVGMLSREDLLEHALLPQGKRPFRVKDVMRVPVCTLKEDAPLEEAARHLAHERVHALVVVDREGVLAGVLSTTDVLEAVAGESLALPALETLPVDVLMTEEPTVVASQATLAEAAWLLHAAGFRHLPVVDEEGRLVGILSERDMRSRLHPDLRTHLESAEAQPPPAVLQAPVSSVMVPRPVSVRRGTPLTEAVDLFADERMGALPVVDEEERVVGILSYVDVMVWLRDRALGRGRGRGSDVPPEGPAAPH